MSLKFGTSGVRGLATDLTDEACAAFARAFTRYYSTLRKGTEKSCIIAGDLRDSTPRIKAAIARGLAAEGYKVLDAGTVPTPTLAYECQQKGLLGIIVTGSHIPADRNGIKFYFPWGEILKPDEEPILKLRSEVEGLPLTATPTIEKIDAEKSFTDRYLNFFGPEALKGLHILYYEHSNVGRDLVPNILRKLGATVTAFDRSEKFIPVDTEALTSISTLGAKVKEAKAFALVSADGDADRPLLLDEQGILVRGDQIGPLAAAALQADSVSTPISSSTCVEKCGWFAEVRHSKIGSPYVVAEMEAAAASGQKRIVGYEANGGFLLGSNLHSIDGKPLHQLVTRDSVLPVLLLLAKAKQEGKTLSQLVKTLPERPTASELIRDFAVEKSQKVLSMLEKGGENFINAAWNTGETGAYSLGPVKNINRMDGIRITFANDEILHFRPSGNAPEFRIYAESRSQSRSDELSQLAKSWILTLQ